MSLFREPIFAIVLILVLVIGVGSQSSSASSSVECGYFPGVWNGQHPVRGRWIATAKPNGKLLIDYLNNEGQRDFRTQGHWVCDPFTSSLRTRTSDEMGNVLELQYRLIELNQDTLVYQQLSNGKPGNTYRSWRIMDI